MTWKGKKPIVKLLDKFYQKGIKLTKKQMKIHNLKLVRSNKLQKYDVIINGSVS